MSVVCCQVSGGDNSNWKSYEIGLGLKIPNSSSKSSQGTCAN